MKNPTLRIAFACTAVMAFALSMPAGVVIVQQSGKVGAAADSKHTLYVEGGKIRMESATEGQKFTIIFDGDKQVLWMLQPDKNTYMEMTKESVEQMSQLASQAMSSMANNPQMQQAMKQAMENPNLTPEQKEMMQKAMAGRMGAMNGGGASAPRTITFAAKGGSDHVGKFSCTLYNELTNGARTAELCVASRDQIPFRENDIQAFKQLAKFMEPMMKMAPKGSYTPPNIEQLHGFPVHTVSYDGDHPTYEVTVLSVDQKSLDGAMFAVPAGYTKQDIMGGMGRGRAPRQ